MLVYLLKLVPQSFPGNRMPQSVCRYRKASESLQPPSLEQNKRLNKSLPKQQQMRILPQVVQTEQLTTQNLQDRMQQTILGLQKRHRKRPFGKRARRRLRQNLHKVQQAPRKRLRTMQPNKSRTSEMQRLRQ